MSREPAESSTMRRTSLMLIPLISQTDRGNPTRLAYVNLNPDNVTNESALQLAVGKDRRELVYRLLEHTVDVNAPPGGPDGQTALHLAFRSEDEAWPERFLRHGADIEAEDENGESLLGETEGDGRYQLPVQNFDVFNSHTGGYKLAGTKLREPRAAADQVKNSGEYLHVSVKRLPNSDPNIILHSNTLQRMVVQGWVDEDVEHHILQGWLEIAEDHDVRSNLEGLNQSQDVAAAAPQQFLADSHFRVGEAIGTELDLSKCPKFSNNADCMAASLMFRLTR
ncbi:unnamed protein product [Clonostachys rosea]|uniref:Uncharacterized protein n=1 Tax=Bionectria ochroleuca TaxID=29856 RepID=A0ABY6UTU2_BIOOC|nr:unnamed protein product [Clonostachys rosea]